MRNKQVFEDIFWKQLITPNNILSQNMNKKLNKPKTLAFDKANSYFN